MSIGRLADNGIESQSRQDDGELVSDSNSFVIGTGERDNDTLLFMLPEQMSQESSEQAMVTENPKVRQKSNFGISFGPISMVVT